MIIKKIIALLTAITSMITIASCKGNITTETNDISTRETAATEMYCINGKLKPVDSYADIEEEFADVIYSKGNDAIAFFDTADLTKRILEKRTPEVLIIERCISIVTNANKDGDGEILNGNGYIKHKAGYEDGTIMLTYFIYNPDTQYYDDITERYDYVLCTEYVD